MGYRCSRKTAFQGDSEKGGTSVGATGQTVCRLAPMIHIGSGQHGKMIRDDGRRWCVMGKNQDLHIPATASKLEKKQAERDKWDWLDF